MIKRMKERLDRIRATKFVKKTKGKDDKYMISQDLNNGIVIHKNGFTLTKTEMVFLRKMLNYIINSRTLKLNDVVNIRHNGIRYNIKYFGMTEFLYRFKIESICKL